MRGEPAEWLTVASGSFSGRLTSDCLFLQSFLGKKSPSPLLTELQLAEPRAPAPASVPPPVELLRSLLPLFLGRSRWGRGRGGCVGM